ncbi:MAG: EpsI family protein [Kiritimatiellae bacterium]|nr:EpsI family protein [Kiritimatiellia bacterium]
MKPATAFFIAAGLMLGLTLAMPSLTRVRFVDEPSIATSLPDNAGGWKGQYILFCQNPEHAAGYILDELTTKCPECGGDLNPLSIFERAVLPDDTRADKRQYTRSDGTILQAALVFSGRDRASIHRPEVCLVAAGSEVIGNKRRLVTFSDRKPLDLQVVNVQQSRKLADGQMVYGKTFFAYWFSGHGRETASHPVRMFWMAWDRILRNRAYPWAYLSVTGIYDQPGDAPLQKLDDFIREIYPLMHSNVTITSETKD